MFTNITMLFLCLRRVCLCSSQLFAAAAFSRFPAEAAARFLLPALADFDRTSYQAGHATSI